MKEPEKELVSKVKEKTDKLSFEKAGKSKSRGHNLRDIPARNPFRQGLVSFTSLLSVLPLTRLRAYSCLVEISTMPLNNLIKWIDLNDYGYG